MKSRDLAVRCKTRPWGSQGFSLVEVCLSLGVISFVAVPLLALMVGGFGQLCSNIDRSQAVTISQKIFLEAQQMDFSTLQKKGSYSEYFSRDGDPLDKGNSRIVYTAKITAFEPSSKAVPLQTVANGAPLTLVGLSVQVHKTPGGSPISQSSAVATFVNMVGCNDLSALSASSAP